MKRLVGIIGIILVMYAITSCKNNDEESADAYRFNHIEGIAAKYAEIILNLDIESVEMQFRLLDISSRCHELEQRGDSMLAVGFRLFIEEKVANENPEKAKRLFGKSSRAFHQ